MNAPTPPYTPGREPQSGPLFTPAPPPPPPSRKSRLPWIIAVAIAVAGVFVVIVMGAAFLADDKSSASPAPAISTADMLPGGDDTTPPEAVPTTAGPLLTPADVKLTLKVTDKQCFGSAGCQVDVKVRATMLTEFISAETWEVTYEISGDESGPIVGSFELTDGKYDVNEESLSTKSSKTKVTVKVTGVEKVGY